MRCQHYICSEKKAEYSCRKSLCVILNICWIYFKLYSKPRPSINKAGSWFNHGWNSRRYKGCSRKAPSTPGSCLCCPSRLHLCWKNYSQLPANFVVLRKAPCMEEQGDTPPCGTTGLGWAGRGKSYWGLVLEISRDRRDLLQFRGEKQCWGPGQVEKGQNIRVVLCFYWNAWLLSASTSRMGWQALHPSNNESEEYQTV